MSRLAYCDCGHQAQQHDLGMWACNVLNMPLALDHAAAMAPGMRCVCEEFRAESESARLRRIGAPGLPGFTP